MSFQVHPSFLQSLMAMFYKIAFLEIVRNVWIEECGEQIHSESSELNRFFLNCRTCLSFQSVSMHCACKRGKELKWFPNVFGQRISLEGTNNLLISWMTFTFNRERSTFCTWFNWLKKGVLLLALNKYGWIIITSISSHGRYQKTSFTEHSLLLFKFLEERGLVNVMQYQVFIMKLRISQTADDQ